MQAPFIWSVMTSQCVVLTEALVIDNENQPDSLAWSTIFPYYHYYEMVAIEQREPSEVRFALWRWPTVQLY